MSLDAAARRNLSDYRQALATTLKNLPLCGKQAADLKIGNYDDNYELHVDEFRVDDLSEDFDSAPLAFLWKADVLRSNPIEIRTGAPEHSG